ncbi:MAG: hypothetical protein KY439_02760 [Actinobacteria bacterium]|nr:hypothetical protein [Actinomycetota bacterium]
MTSASGPPAAPKDSPAEAARALLEAEQAGDHESSFLLLSAAARKTHASAADWARRRQELPPITGFKIEREEGDKVTALVDHQPGLDPFIGLSPARERQTWTAQKAKGGWLLEAEPQVEMLLPPTAAAKEAAVAWATALQNCDEAAARRLQVVGTLFGLSDAPSGLCRTPGAISAGSPEPLPPGPASQELVAQYGTEVFDWATAVPVTGPVRPFHLVLAPIGDTWQVLGLFES